MTNDIKNTTTQVKPATCNNLKSIPNSWGHQHYDGEYFRVKVDNQLDINKNLARYGTLRGFVVRHIEGIRLKGKEKIDYCKNCTCQEK